VDIHGEEMTLAYIYCALVLSNLSFTYKRIRIITFGKGIMKNVDQFGMPLKSLVQNSGYHCCVHCLCFVPVCFSQWQCQICIRPM